MQRRSFLLPALALAGLLLFFYLLTRLLLLRYERGDVYPAYSTLRADPLGTRAFYEALSSLPDYEVDRGFTSLHRELENNPGTLFYLGGQVNDLYSFNQDEVAELDAYVKNGGRLIMTFLPVSPETVRLKEKDKVAETKKEIVTEPPAAQPGIPAPELTPQPPPDPNPNAAKTDQEAYEREKFQKEKEKEAKDNPGHPNELAAEKYQPSLAARWGFGWDIVQELEKEKADAPDSATPPKPDQDKTEVLAQHEGDGDVEPSVPWKSALYFVRLEPAWQQLYQAKDHPVFIRRNWGKGEILVASDSYFISNEALRNDRRIRLLGLLAGAPGLLLFDESHLGTQKQEGTMSLAEKFRLQGYLAGLLVVVFLFLWRNSVPLVPPRPLAVDARRGGAVSGKDSHSGLVNLLRRNIPVSDLLKTSLAEWRRHVTPRRRHLHGKRAEMEALLTSSPGTRAESIVHCYHQLRQINTHRPDKTYATKP